MEQWLRTKILKLLLGPQKLCDGSTHIYILGNFHSLWAYKYNGTGWSLTESIQTSI